VDRIVAARKAGRFESVDELHKRSGISKPVIERLAEADAFSSIDRKRRIALWEGLELTDEQMPLFGIRDEETKRRRDEVPAPTSSLNLSVSSSLLPTMPLGQEVMTDYSTTGLSLKAHPVSLIRGTLSDQKIITSKQLQEMTRGKWVRVAGLVLIRQRPGTASGIVFVTLEDETGIVNLIIRPDIFERYQSVARHAALMQAEGYVERQGEVIHVLAKRLFDRSELIRGYAFTSRDFH
jgi:error-prone DNA polymerase